MYIITKGYSLHCATSTIGNAIDARKLYVPTIEEYKNDNTVQKKQGEAVKLYPSTIVVQREMKVMCSEELEYYGRVRYNASERVQSS